MPFHVVLPLKLFSRLTARLSRLMKGPDLADTDGPVIAGSNITYSHPSNVSWVDEDAVAGGTNDDITSADSSVDTSRSARSARHQLGCDSNGPSKNAPIRRREAHDSMRAAGALPLDDMMSVCSTPKDRSRRDTVRQSAQDTPAVASSPEENTPCRSTESSSNSLERRGKRSLQNTPSCGLGDRCTSDDPCRLEVDNENSDGACGCEREDRQNSPFPHSPPLPVPFTSNSGPESSTLTSEAVATSVPNSQPTRSDAPDSIKTCNATELPTVDTVTRCSLLEANPISSVKTKRTLVVVDGGEKDSPAKPSRDVVVVDVCSSVGVDLTAYPPTPSSGNLSRPFKIDEVERSSFVGSNSESLSGRPGIIHDSSAQPRRRCLQDARQGSQQNLKNLRNDSDSSDRTKESEGSRCRDLQIERIRRRRNSLPIKLEGNLERDGPKVADDQDTTVPTKSVVRRRRSLPGESRSGILHTIAAKNTDTFLGLRIPRTEHRGPEFSPVRGGVMRGTHAPTASDADFELRWRGGTDTRHDVARQEVGERRFSSPPVDGRVGTSTMRVEKQRVLTWQTAVGEEGTGDERRQREHRKSQEITVKEQMRSDDTNEECGETESARLEAGLWCIPNADEEGLVHPSKRTQPLQAGAGTDPVGALHTLLSLKGQIRCHEQRKGRGREGATQADTATNREFNDEVVPPRSGCTRGRASQPLRVGSSKTEDAPPYVLRASDALTTAFVAQATAAEFDKSEMPPTGKFEESHVNAMVKLPTVLLATHDGARHGMPSSRITSAAEGEPCCIDSGSCEAHHLLQARSGGDSPIQVSHDHKILHQRTTQVPVHPTPAPESITRQDGVGAMFDSSSMEPEVVKRSCVLPPEFLSLYVSKVTPRLTIHGRSPAERFSPTYHRSAPYVHQEGSLDVTGGPTAPHRGAVKGTDDRELGSTLHSPEPHILRSQRSGRSLRGQTSSLKGTVASLQHFQCASPEGGSTLVGGDKEVCTDLGLSPEGVSLSSAVGADALDGVTTEWVSRAEMDGYGQNLAPQVGRDVRSRRSNANIESDEVLKDVYCKTDDICRMDISVRERKRPASHARRAPAGIGRSGSRGQRCQTYKSVHGFTACECQTEFTRRAQSAGHLRSGSSVGVFDVPSPRQPRVSVAPVFDVGPPPSAATPGPLNDNGAVLAALLTCTSRTAAQNAARGTMGNHLLEAWSVSNPLLGFRATGVVRGPNS